MGLGIISNSLSNWAKAHNTKENATEARRVYIYSPSDTLIDDKAVEAHAAEARMKGFSVKLEKYKDSAHVAHARTDENRYWEIIQKAWDRECN